MPKMKGYFNRKLYLQNFFLFSFFIFLHIIMSKERIHMRMRKILSAILLFGSIFNGVAQQSYNNPVVDLDLPDPTIIKADDGFFYLYTTETVRNLPVLRSSNLVDWQLIGTAFSAETRPNFVPGGNIWAPDINKIGNKYVLYYSMSTWGGEWTSGIGVAVADRPEDNGHKYLFFGSFRGIYVIELNEDGLSVKKDFRRLRIAGTAYEGTYIHKRDGFYYLFASIGTCCEGAKSTYTTVVGRSKELFGPYFNKKNKSMLDNRHEVLIHKNEVFTGTGHNSEIVQDENGDDWIFYHGVKLAEPEGRVLLMDKIDWIDGWPVIKGNSPSIESSRPKF